MLLLCNEDDYQLMTEDIQADSTKKGGITVFIGIQNLVSVCLKF